MNTHHKLNYLEFAAIDLEATKAFFGSAFGWSFQDYGPDYSALVDAGWDGGFFRADLASTTHTGGALAILYSDDLESSLATVENAGGRILKPIFAFPGGRRFHFVEPSGNEFAVWGY